jgi:hypothetical protein
MPDLTYFIGRPFDSLVKENPRAKKGKWEIHLQDDAIIANKDPQVTVPDAEILAGTSFIRPIYSELDTRLQFGVLDAVAIEIILNPTKYTISDPTFVQEGEIYPQVAPEVSIPADPSEERVAEGPEEGSEMSTEESETQEEGTEEDTEESTEESGDESGDESTEESGGDEEEATT